MDGAILAVSHQRWQKVSRVLGKALDRLRGESKPAWWPEGDRADLRVTDALHDRIDALIDAKALLVQGNVWWPGHSEIRLSNEHDRERPIGFPDERDIDFALLWRVDLVWQKVAKIVSFAVDDLGRADHPKPEWWTEDSGAELWEAVTERIEVLVAKGRLEAEGNLWRADRSVVRSAGAHADKLRGYRREIEEGGFWTDEERAAAGPLAPEQIDAVVLSLVSDRFRKVARILADTIEALRPPRAGASDADCAAIVERIEALVAQERIEADGDVREIRESYVRIRAAGDARPAT